jgi:nucleoside-diphosphate-sugar epimerase
VDEILASAYQAQSGVYSVGVRFPNSVYGPWGSKGSQEYKLAEAAVRYWQWDGQKKDKGKIKGSKRNGKQDTIMGLAGLSQATDEVRDYLFVDGKYYH